jgi:hypothetical protein
MMILLYILCIVRLYRNIDSLSKAILERKIPGSRKNGLEGGKISGKHINFKK